jgi:hypothetical protein
MLSLIIQIQNPLFYYLLFRVSMAFVCQMKKQNDELNIYHIQLIKLLLLTENSVIYFRMSKKYRQTLMPYPYPKITIPIEISRIDIPQFRPL